MTPKLIKLEEWAHAIYGNAAPALFTLRRWARDGNIRPQPRKHGRTYFVEPDASYVTLSAGRRQRLVDRLRGKEAGRA